MVIEIARAKAEDKLIVGIDFGTTNSIIAAVIQGRVQILAEMPSVVSVCKDGRLVIGKKAGCVTISSIKRLLGKTFQEYEMVKGYFDPKIEIVFAENEDLKIKVCEKIFSPIEIATTILQHLKILAEIKIGQSIDTAVITVPAYFDSNAKKGVVMAAKAAGMHILRVIAEPTAAAYAYGLEKNVLGQYLVFDLGGGTFDVSILKMNQGIFRVLAVGGDSFLGGDDIDSILLNYIFTKHQLIDSKECLNIRDAVQKAKEQLSISDSVILEIFQGQFQITRDVLEHLIEGIVCKVMEITKNLVSSEGMELQGILLVGGSTKMPIFETSLRSAFPTTKILKDLDPDRIVAMGAGLQAYNLSHQSKDVLIDVNPLSLGIELMDGLVEVIIPRNSSIPTYASKRFTTHLDGQTAMQFNVVQGERDLAKNCVSLAKFVLKGIPKLRAGEAQIEVLFALDANCVLSVTSTEISTQISQEIVVSASYAGEEVKEMLANAMEHFEEDFNQRLLLEIKNKSKGLIKSIYRVVQKEVIQQEYNNVHQDILALSHALEEKSIDEIQYLLEQLEGSSLPLFSNVLEASIRHAVVGKIVKEIE